MIKNTIQIGHAGIHNGKGTPKATPKAKHNNFLNFEYKLLTSVNEWHNYYFPLLKQDVYHFLQ